MGAQMVFSPIFSENLQKELIAYGVDKYVNRE